MVQINLLPAEAKKKRRDRIALQVNLKPVLFILIGVMVIIFVVWVALGVQLAGRERKLSQLEAELDSSRSILEKLNKLKQEKEALLRQLEFMDQTLKTEILWAKNFNRLSDLLPAGVWIKSITLETKQQGNVSKNVKLDIRGSAISAGGKEMIDLISGFMSLIKKDEVFAGQLSEIELVSSRRGMAGNIATMDFQLFCHFR